MYAPRGPYKGGEGGIDRTSTPNFSFKNKLNGLGREFIFGGEISWKGGGNLKNIVINLPRTYEKFHCEKEPYWLKLPTH